MRRKLLAGVLVSLGLLLPALTAFLLGANYLYGPGGTNTIFVAAADASPTEKSKANYICTGTAGNPIDDITLNAALTAAGAGRGINCSTGHFEFNAPLAMTSSQFIRGAGMGQTFFRMGASVTSALTGASAAGQTTLKVTSTAGFRAGQAVTIFSSTALAYNKGESNFIASLTDTALVMVNNLAGPVDYSGASWAAADNAIVFTTNSGIALAKPVYLNAAAGVTDCEIRDLTLDGNKANNRFGNSDEYQNGVYMARSHRTKVHNVKAQNWSQAGFLSSHYGTPDSGSNDCEFINCVAYNNGDADSAGTKKAGGFHMHGGERFKFINCHSEANSPWGYYAYDWKDSTGMNLTATNDVEFGYWFADCRRNTFTNIVAFTNTTAAMTTAGIYLAHTGTDLYPCRENIFSNVQVTMTTSGNRYGTNGPGIYLNTNTEDNVFNGVISKDGGSYNFWDKGINNSLADATLTTTGHSACLWTETGYGTRLQNVRATNYTTVNYTVALTTSNSRVDNSVFVNTAAQAALRLTGSHCQVANSRISSSAYGLASSGAARVGGDNNSFSGCIFRETTGAAFSSSGTNVLLTGCMMFSSSATPYYFTGAGSSMGHTFSNGAKVAETTLAITGANHTDGTGAATVQVKDSAGNAKAGARLLRVWTGGANDYGVDALTGFTVTTGTQVVSLTANAVLVVATDATGAAVLDLNKGSAGDVYVWAEMDGVVYASGAIAITGP